MAPWLLTSLGCTRWQDEYYSLTEVDLRSTALASVTSVSTGHTLAPLATTTGAIGTSCTASGEAHEGLLVTITGATVMSEPSSYGEIMIDDGSGVTQLEDSILDTDAHLASLLNSSITGTYLTSVSGVVRYAYSSFEVHPRTASDVVLGTAPPMAPPSVSPPPPMVPIFFSEFAEGSSNNKYAEIYNPSGTPVSLDLYAYPSVSNAPTTPGTHEYWNTFDAGAVVPPYGVYVLCHPSADAAILNKCNGTYQYFSNGDDGMCLVYGTASSFSLVDCFGDFHGDPGSGWDMCGTAAATRDHVLVRKSSVTQGNMGDWTSSAGTSTSDCEWTVLANEDWSNLGFHAGPVPPVVTIAQINTNSSASGPGCYHSEMVGMLVSVTGYVTALDTYGFYMQHSTTSALHEGLYVYVGSSQSANYNAAFLSGRSVGEKVTVVGLVVRRGAPDAPHGRPWLRGC